MEGEEEEEDEEEGEKEEEEGEDSDKSLTHLMLERCQLLTHAGPHPVVKPYGRVCTYVRAGDINIRLQLSGACVLQTWILRSDVCVGLGTHAAMQSVSTARDH